MDHVLILFGVFWHWKSDGTGKYEEAMGGPSLCAAMLGLLGMESVLFTIVTH